MEDPQEAAPRRHRLPHPSAAVVASVITAIVVGVGAFLIGHHLGEADDHPRAQFLREQQAAVISKFEETSRRLVEIEQSGIALLEGKSGAEVDLDAYYSFHTTYTHEYDVVLGQIGRVNALFSGDVRTDAKAVSHTANVALGVLFPSRAELARMDARQISALIGNSHTARKGQWQAIRTFVADATDEMLHAD